MTFKEKNENAIIMECYANKKFQYDVKNEKFWGYVFWWSELS